MFKRRTLLKSAFSLFLVLEFFVASTLPASALFGGSFSIPSASQMAAELENRYHLNLDSIQNQGESFNVAGNKTMTPEVSLFFNPSDPRPGEKISAQAFPIYFANPVESLYYTWYLKREDCDLRDNVGDNNSCDANEDGDITVEDWKIDAARILVQGGYDPDPKPDYDVSSDDNDGYKAKYGGDNKTNVPNHCYINDAETGTNREFVKRLPDFNFGCESGTTAVCVVAQNEVQSGSDSDNAFTTDVTGTSYISGSPYCSASTLTCGVGEAKCATNPDDVTLSGLTDPTANSCDPVSKSEAEPYCFHLFPNLPATGDGIFGASEENFWDTDPQDPSTADNGKKDEANAVGLGMSTFMWNYAPGDKVGVAVEGTTMLPTKDDDSSSMIMWAFPKKDCSVGDLKKEDSDIKDGAYVMSIRGYVVDIPAVTFFHTTPAKDPTRKEMNSTLDRCIAKNLVDPTEGGQATKLDVSVTVTPDNPINDATDDKSGDIVIVQASVNNAQHNVTDMLFDWKVEISPDISFTDNNNLDITMKLREWGLLGNIRGNALDMIRLKLDILSDNNHKFSDGEKLSDYLIGGVGYLNFKAVVKENFSGNSVRKGNSDVTVKFTSTDRKIIAYRAGTSSAGATTTATLGTRMCNKGDADSTVLDRTACRVIKNEIIGLKVDPSLGLSNFYWMVNGAPLICSKKVSGDCSDTQQNNVNFIPVTGNPGDTYTVTVTANDIKADGAGNSTDNMVTLTRTFGVVAPAVTIEPLDGNIVWPKLLGQYRDITGKVAVCSGGLCNDYSTSMFEAFPGSTLGFRAVFIPGFLGSTAVKEWSVDGGTIAESPAGGISFMADKLAGGIYNINLAAQVRQSDETRRALLDIWGISPFDSSEINFSTAIQVQLQEPGLVEGPQNGPRKYLAAIVSYIPASLMFTLRIFLSAVLALFALSLLYTFLEEQRVRAFVESLSREKR